MRYRPTTMDELRACLGACPAEIPVETERCIPVDLQTVAELRSLSAWPPGWLTRSRELRGPLHAKDRFQVADSCCSSRRT